MKKVKIVFLDGQDIRAIRGEIIAEDNFFVTLLRNDAREVRIAKQQIQSIKPVVEVQR